MRASIASIAFGAVLALAALPAAPSSPALAAGPPSGQAGPEPRIATLRHLRVIALDPGHGGENTGCLGVEGSYEKRMTLALAERVEALLLAETDAAVLLTRRDDRPLGLRQRTEMANAWDADVFLSLHFNADAYGRGHGVETWYLADSAADAAARKVVASEEEAYGDVIELEYGEPADVHAVVQDAMMHKAQADSRELATAVAEHMARTTTARGRGVHQAAFGVLKYARMPAAVVEGGFMTHRKEGVQIQDPAYLDKIARGIVAGLIAFDESIGGARQVSAVTRGARRGEPGR